jgi:acyl-coenzyme A synthetase/AMP-(fatty) acid ligase
MLTSLHLLVSVYIECLTVVVLLAKDPIVKKYDLSSLRVINSSSAPLKEDLLMAVYTRLGIPVKQGITPQTSLK